MEGRRYKNYKLSKTQTFQKKHISKLQEPVCIMNFKRPISRYIIQFQNTRDMRRFQLLPEREKQIHEERKSAEHQILTATLYIRGQWGNTFKILWKNNLNVIFHSQSNCQIKMRQRFLACKVSKQLPSTKGGRKY